MPSHHVPQKYSDAAEFPRSTTQPPATTLSISTTADAPQTAPKTLHRIRSALGQSFRTATPFKKTAQAVVGDYLTITHAGNDEEGSGSEDIIEKEKGKSKSKSKGLFNFRKSGHRGGSDAHLNGAFTAPTLASMPGSPRRTSIDSNGRVSIDAPRRPYWPTSLSSPSNPEHQDLIRTASGGMERQREQSKQPPPFRGQHVANKPAIGLGKVKWPDDFLDALPPPKSPTPDLPSPTSSSISPPRKLAIVGATKRNESVESLPQFPRRPSHRARHSIDVPVLLPRDSSPGSDGMPVGSRVLPRRNSTKPSMHRSGSLVPRSDSRERSTDALVPFPRTASGEHSPALSSSPPRGTSPFSDKPRPPRGRFQSDVEGSSRRRPRPSSYDELGAKPSPSRFESMMNLGVASGNTSASDLLTRDSLGGSFVRQALIIREEGKPPTHFQLGNCIGRGQVGSVYRALNLNTGQMVAVKRIRLENLKEDEVTTLMREVDLVKSLSHPSIVKYEGMARNQDILSIVLEYAENGSLGQTLKAFGKLNERLVASYVVKILEGLHYLHSSDVVHCDLRAANILTTKNGNVKLSDFGVSLNLPAMDREIKDVAGTPNWMAPEVIELKGASPKSDIWSLACTVVELLTGRPPYAELANSMSVMFRIVDDDRPPLPDGCSPILEDFLMQCFDKDPAKRPSANLLCEHPWLKENWGLHKELRPQDSLRSVSSHSYKPEAVRFLAQIDMPGSPAEGEEHIGGSPPKKRRVSISSRPMDKDLHPREHSFVKTTFSKPMVCRVCSLNVKKSAVLCEQCNLITHSKCAINAPPTCDLRAQLLLYAQDAEKDSTPPRPSPHVMAPITPPTAFQLAPTTPLTASEFLPLAAFKWSDFGKDYEVLLRLGITYKQQGKYEESLQCFDRILRNAPSSLADAYIWLQIGHVYEQQKDHVSAKDAYERVVNDNPSHPKALRQLGWLYHRDGSSFQNQDLATRYLTKSLEANPSDVQSWYLLGRAYMAGQKYNKAYEAYQQAVYLDGRNPTFWCSIGVLYFQINQYRDALDAYSRAIHINPYISEVWCNLGSLYESCNNPISDAIDAYARASELDPNNLEISQRVALLKNAQATGWKIPVVLSRPGLTGSQSNLSLGSPNVLFKVQDTGEESDLEDSIIQGYSRSTLADSLDPLSRPLTPRTAPGIKMPGDDNTIPATLDDPPSAIHQATANLREWIVTFIALTQQQMISDQVAVSVSEEAVEGSVDSVDFEFSSSKVYEHLILFIVGEVGHDERFCTTLEQLVQFIVTLDPVWSLVQSSQFRIELLKISSMLGISNDQRLRDALQKDEADIARLFKLIVSSDIHKKAILRLKGRSAQNCVDLIQDVLDKRSLQAGEEGFTLKARRLLVKLSQASDTLPSSLFIEGVSCLESEATFGGAFGDIYRASYQGQDVALKRICVFQRDSGRHMIRQQFCREALLWQRLQNPFVLPFIGIDAESFPSFLCMVSPWMRQGTILKHLAENGNTNVDRRLFEIAQGLVYLHSQRIIHGDLRGSNILVDDEFHACLADFGLAVFADATAATRTSHHGGSVRWMGPELHYPQSCGLETFQRTFASDVYSFASVCVELYTEKPPFSDISNDAAVMLRIVAKERPARPCNTDGQNLMSDAMWDIIQQCWSHNPSARPSMASVVERMLEVNNDLHILPIVRVQ